MIVLLIIALITGLVLIRILPRIQTIDVTILKTTKEEEATSKVTKKSILESSGIKEGDRLYGKLRSEISEEIEKNPYVKSAKVERDFSGTVKIEIEQRSPSYLVNYAGEFIYIDKEGYILEVSNENIGKPIIIGFSTDFSKLEMGNSKIRLNSIDIEKLQVVNNIMSVIQSNGIENVITSVDITDKKNFVLNLENDGKTVQLGDGSDLNTKILYMKKILEKEVGNTGIIYIGGDLDEGYVYYREQ